LVSRRRYQIILHADQGWSGRKIGRALDRYEQFGNAGLIDRREDNGDAKADAECVPTVWWILESLPQAFFHHRPPWTKALLIQTDERYTGVRLRKIGARRGRAKPLAPCPWSQRRKNRRMKLIRVLIDTLVADQACVCEDEADINLNPRIGADWMMAG
jgi:hypothetical protein